MSGARSRRKGHRWEVECASRLAEVTGAHVVTTRSLGATYGADLATVLHYDQLGRPVASVPWVAGPGKVKWSVECKNVRTRSPRGWLRQAVEQAAPFTTPVVLWHRHGKPLEDGSVFLLDDGAARGWVELPLGGWLERFADGCV